MWMCNQDHMMLLQEVLQHRTGSRNTRTASLVLLSQTPQPIGGLDMVGMGVVYSGHIIYVCVCVEPAGWY